LGFIHWGQGEDSSDANVHTVYCKKVKIFRKSWFVRSDNGGGGGGGGMGNRGVFFFFFFFWRLLSSLNRLFRKSYAVLLCLDNNHVCEFFLSKRNFVVQNAFANIRRHRSNRHSVQISYRNSCIGFDSH